MGGVLPHDHIGGYFTIEGETEIRGSLKVTKNPLCLFLVLDGRVRHVHVEMIECKSHVRRVQLGQ
jgi:hypothetical protein